MSYSRLNPSPRYLELVESYRTLHEKGETFLGIPPADTFPGSSLAQQVERIKRLIERTKALTILDYGSGKGRQYDPQPFKDKSGKRWDSIIDYWDIDEVVCFDPCYAPFSRIPRGRFDGVISTDVLEHCPEEDVPWIIAELFRYADKFVFANVACYPARKRLPSGENAHCTIRPVAWWRARFETAAAAYPNLLWEVWVQSLTIISQERKMVEDRIGTS